ncbi:MAG TPA: PSD1 and planctomycete cytochrome C domain-containing protein [Pirellulales bacterium]|nr:PSD1 and planctomycete cytochrome C domain-containing protein [Pirellulales bacterium]
MLRLRVLACCYVVGCFPAGRSAAADEAVAQAAPAVDYSRQIKPLLSDRCYACHGPDAGQRKGDLALHVRSEAVKEAIKPGNAAASTLIERLTSHDPEFRMPPVDSKKPPLTPDEIEQVRRWIDEGAPFDAHWAFVKPERPSPPVVKNQAAKNPAWAQSPLDAFVALGQQEHDLMPAPQADRRTLIRRLSFDLTGLPPKPAEIDAFLADASGDGYEKLVDKLLDSPHFGERMAQYWLDVVRYGDTGGYHSDNHRDIWLYRDYVIAAFNSNKPFDRFVTEQLAGDLLPNATREQRIASGFNRLLMTTEEGGAQPKEYTAKYAADRVRNTGGIFLGATLGCAECHDHKFDPFTTRDFYRFEAFFADVKELAVGRQEQTAMPTEPQAAEMGRLDAGVAPLQSQLDEQTPALDAALAEWEADRKSRRVEWIPLTASSVESLFGATFKTLDDGSLVVAGGGEKDTYSLAVPTTLKGLTALRLEVLPDDALPSRGPGRAANGNFVLHEVEATFNGAAVTWSAVSGSHSQNDFPAAAAADGNPATGWAVLPQVGQANHLVLEAASDLGDGNAAVLTLKLHQNYGGGHTIGRFRLSATTAPRPVRALGAGGPPPDVVKILDIDRAARNDGQKQALAAYYRTIAPLLQPTRDQLAALVKRRNEILAAAPTTLVSMPVEPRLVRILPRGNWLDDSGEIARPAVPAFLPQAARILANPATAVEGGRPTRLDLAAWMTSRDNPLVARVFVNRLWKLCFGQGIVRTLEDFGTQGAWPTHPRLLDWLAVEFIESGWDVKHMLRLMVTSNTYRQVSDAPSGTRERDPSNQWFARQARFRLDAEMVRDNALAIAGLLSEKVGGPSVKPYQPAGYWAHLNFPIREWENDHGESQYRRGLYTYWQRTFLHPSLLAFDAPSREECTAERPRSNTPLQALVLLNDPTYVEAARVFAAKILREAAASPAERAALALRQALGREAKPDEVAILVGLYEKHARQYAAAPAAAGELLQVGEAKPPTDAAATELAAWTSVARAILNLHETITRY